MGYSSKSKVFAFLQSFLILGCTALGPSDRNRTVHNLHLLRHAFEIAAKMDVDIRKCTSLDEFLSIAATKGIITEEDFKRERFKCDSWGHPFHWRVAQENDTTPITITSDGENGRPEGGNGDDLSIEIVLHGNTVVSTSLKKP